MAFARRPLHAAPLPTRRRRWGRLLLVCLLGGAGCESTPLPPADDLASRVDLASPFDRALSPTLDHGLDLAAVDLAATIDLETPPDLMSPRDYSAALADSAALPDLVVAADLRVGLEPPPDLVVPIDLATSADLRFGRDLVMLLDLAVPDLAPPPDLVVPRDMTVPRDFTPPPDLVTRSCDIQCCDSKWRAASPAMSEAQCRGEIAATCPAATGGGALKVRFAGRDVYSAPLGACSFAGLCEVRCCDGAAPDARLVADGTACAIAAEAACPNQPGGPSELAFEGDRLRSLRPAPCPSWGACIGLCASAMKGLSTRAIPALCLRDAKQLCAGEGGVAVATLEGVAILPGRCGDGIKNDSETAIDCGGISPSCAACGDGKACLSGYDCASSVCKAGACAAASCVDGAHNGSESDTDCGGGCAKCGGGKRCQGGGDCQSLQCVNRRCL